MAIMAMGAALAFAACGKDDDNNNGSGTDNGGSGGTESAEWVDLGLPSGLLWAKWNLGATNPEEYGDYYDWGETSAKEVYDWSTYKYCTVDGEGELATLTKYNTSIVYGTPDNLTTLEAMDDAATQKLGSGARMPTQAEWEELINNTTAEWTTLNGVKGRKFTASNGNSLFLPAAGVRSGSELRCAGEQGHYWSSSLYANVPRYAWNFYFDSGYQDVNYDLGRGRGKSVRPVRSAR